MEQKTFYTEDEMLDEFIGKTGTPARDNFESKLQNEIDSCHLGAKTHDEMLDEFIGKRGTHEREEYESNVRQALNDYHLHND